MTTRRWCVLDASAVLAVFEREPGWQRVSSRLSGSQISAVNWSEVMQKNLERGIAVTATQAWGSSNGVQVKEFGRADAESAAVMWSLTKSAGLSLGDRACLALAKSLSLPALTADSRWRGATAGVEVEFIR